MMIVLLQKKIELSKNSLKQDQANITVKKLISEVGNIYFESGCYEISRESKIQLDQLSKILIDYPTFEILIVTHTDSKGTEKYNQWLSEKRALSIKIFLQRKISKHRIYTESFGEKKLMNLCTKAAVCSESLHRENRRAEFIVFRD